jgi:hypothetical protein
MSAKEAPDIDPSDCFENGDEFDIDSNRHGTEFEP